VTGGVERVVLACGHHAGVVRDHFGESFRGMRVDYTVEGMPLGTAGAIALAGRGIDAPSSL
jgi:NDP-sugar pyrophosphorylase family protein